MTISRQPDGKYLVIHFEKEHNHELVPREQAHMLPSQRKVTAAQAIEADMANKFGIPQKLAFEFMNRQVGGRENAMSGKKPITILTDQDHAMAKAIKSVFPEVNHRLCMWQNTMKHLGHYFKIEDSFAKDLESCINSHEKEKEFFQAWEAFLIKYNLKDNDWLSSRFKEREKWAMVYRRQTFSAGMKSTQLMADQRYNEMKSDYDMSQRIPALKVNATMLKHAREIYKKNLIKVVMLCCKKFEFVGILCFHALKVLDLRNIKIIPGKYFIKRWMKSAKVGSVEDVHGCIVEEDPRLVMSSRYKELSRTAIKLTTWAAESEEGYNILNGVFREGMLEMERLCVRKCDAFQNDKTKVTEGAKTIKNKDGNEEVIIGDHLNNLKSKGLKKKERAPGGKRWLMSSLEQSLKKRKGGSNQLSTPNIIAGNQSSRTKIVSPPLPSNFVHSLSYQHPSYYQWQLPILNPQMEVG
uniref:Protein FAR1-RELATED SEQUENCE n=1 Tax=Fagus sylvatica TaxID=28930 RepID=A0A2N9INJ9_FAGSY